MPMLCPNKLDPGAAALVPWLKPPNAEGATGLAFVGWPKAGKGVAGDEAASAPPNVLGVPDDDAEGAMPKEGAPVVPGAAAAPRLKESPFPKGKEAGAGVADACCPRPPNALKPAQSNLPQMSVGAALVLCSALK